MTESTLKRRLALKIHEMPFSSELKRNGPGLKTTWGGPRNIKEVGDFRALMG